MAGVQLIINKKYRVIVLMVMLLGVASCSTQMVYKNLDWVASWYLDDYITLTSLQEKQFDSTVDAFLLWHKKSELKNYVQQIKVIQTDLKKGMKREDIESYATAVKGFLAVALVKAEPDITTMAYSLSDVQIVGFLKEVEQENLKKIEKHNDSTSQERLDKRFDKVQEQVTEYVGSLSAEQNQIIRDANQKLLPGFDHFIQFRRDWANAISVAYALRNSTEGDELRKKQAFESALKRPILATNTLRSKEYITLLEYNQSVWIDTLESLIVSLNEKQSAHLDNKLNDMIEDLEALL